MILHDREGCLLIVNVACANEFINGSGVLDAGSFLAHDSATDLFPVSYGKFVWRLSIVTTDVGICAVIQ